MSDNKSVAQMVSVMVFVVLLMTVFCSGLLYRVGLERSREHLSEIVQSQIALINAVAKFDQQFSVGDHPQGAAAATLSQVLLAYSEYRGVGETGEFLIAHREGDMIHFESPITGDGHAKPQDVPWEGSLAQPMRRALSGESGVMVGLDYKGDEVMAAFGPVNSLQIGIVAKIEMAELRQPYLIAVFWSVAIAVLLVALGGAQLVRLWRPVLQRIIEQNETMISAQASLAKAQAIAHVGHWDWNIISGRLAWSDEIYRIFGLQPQQIESTYQQFLQHIHPADQEAVQKAVESALACVDCQYEVEHRILRPDGEVRYVLERGDVMRNELNEPISMVGTVQDITERKRVEKQLLLSDQVFNHTSEAIVVTSPSGEIVSVNNAFTRITGYRFEEVMGKKPSMMRSGRHDANFYREMWQALLENGHWSGEIWDRKKNGTEFPKWLSINSIKNEDEEVVYYIGIFSDISVKKRTEEQLQQLAFYDSLTMLPNRVLCRERLEHGLRIAERHKNKLAVLFLDLDRFKLVNDSLGHDAGDELLLEAARRIKHCVRESDTVARLGGDEFMVLINDIVDVSMVERIANKIIQVIGERFHVKGHEVNVGVSIGISMFPDNGLDYDELIKNADTAMYRAKESGRNTFSYFTRELQAAIMHRVALENRLQRALVQDELQVYYQPKLDVQSEGVIGMEALVRWQSPEYGLIPPDDFISIAEETGLIMQLDTLVMRKACEQTKRWQQAGCGPLTVSVNVSRRQFEQEGFVEKVDEILQTTGLSPECLEIEVTESLVMQNVSRAVVQMERLRALGVGIAIDDFGAGYSSLTYLKRLPIHCLKIDRSFVSDIGTDGDDEAIVAAIVSMATTLGLSVVAEGVEKDAQFSFLKAQGCQYVQGYLFGRPMTAEAFGEYLQVRIDNCRLRDGLFPRLGVVS